MNHKVFKFIYTLETILSTCIDDLIPISVAILNDNEDNFDWNKLNWWIGYAQLDKNLKDKVKPSNNS